jgi:hypothetical protein
MLIPFKYVSCRRWDAQHATGVLIDAREFDSGNENPEARFYTFLPMRGRACTTTHHILRA